MSKDTISTRKQDSTKLKKKGFSVGPANLPDGTYRRKVVKIKRDLIHKAKVRKEYAKVRTREQEAGNLNVNPAVVNAIQEAQLLQQDAKDGIPPKNTMHEDRIAALTAPEPDPSIIVVKRQQQEDTEYEHKGRRPKTAKTSRYMREEQEGQRVREVKEAHARMLEEKEAAAVKREGERKKRNNTMGYGRSARTKTGQAKLGRQSKGLLDQVMKSVGQ